MQKVFIENGVILTLAIFFTVHEIQERKSCQNTSEFCFLL